MTLHKLIKPVILTCALTANICAAEMPDLTTGYNFATIKGGIVSPSSAPEGNSNLNIGNSTYTAGILVGRTFLERYAVDFEYMYRGENTAKNSSVAMTTATAAQATSNSWGVKSNTFMLSLSANLLKDNMVTPYVRAGLGLSNNRSSNYISTATGNTLPGSAAPNTVTYAGKTTNEFAYQIGAGLNVTTSQMFDTQIEYMYVNRGKIKTNSAVDVGSGALIPSNTVPAITGYLQDHVITLGIKFKF